MRKNNKTGKRLRLTPLILGGYAAFLGFGLVAIGLAEIKPAKKKSSRNL